MSDRGEELLAGIRWLFFDLGSMLIDETGPEEHRASQFQALAGNQGVELTIAEIKRLISQAAAEHEPDIMAGAMKKVLADARLAESLAQTIVYDHAYEAPYSCAKKVLAALCCRYKLGIIANQKFGAEDRLIGYGIRSFFSLIVSSAEAGVCKPDPAIFKLALQGAGCQPHQAVMVGDRLDNDIKPAKALGMGTIWIRQGYHGLALPRNESEKPDFTINTLEELTENLL